MKRDPPFNFFIFFKKNPDPPPPSEHKKSEIHAFFGLFKVKMINYPPKRKKRGIKPFFNGGGHTKTNAEKEKKQKRRMK